MSRAVPSLRWRRWSQQPHWGKRVRTRSASSDARSRGCAKTCSRSLRSPPASTCRSAWPKSWSPTWPRSSWWWCTAPSPLATAPTWPCWSASSTGSAVSRSRSWQRLRGGGADQPLQAACPVFRLFAYGLADDVAAGHLAEQPGDRLGVVAVEVGTDLGGPVARFVAVHPCEAVLAGPGSSQLG